MAEADDTTVLESGDIFFFYRPRTNEDDPESLGDVQRFYFAMRPKGGQGTRLCLAGRKHLPDVKSHERIWVQCLLSACLHSALDDDAVGHIFP